MNNQPYFRYSHLDDIVRHRAGKSMDILKQALRDLDQLDEEAAVAALAAYIRSRTAAEVKYREQLKSAIGPAADVAHLLEGIESFLDPDSPSVDRPLRLQAVVGGLVRASGAAVSSQSLNDPSSRAPGDAHVPDSASPRWVAEVKARPISEGEALTFVNRVGEYGGIEAAWIVAIHPEHEPLPREVLSEVARSHRLMALVAESIVEMVALLIGHPRAHIPASIDASQAIAEHLTDMRADGTTIEEWKRLFLAVRK